MLHSRMEDPLITEIMDCVYDKKFGHLLALVLKAIFNVAKAFRSICTSSKTHSLLQKNCVFIKPHDKYHTLV